MKKLFLSLTAVVALLATSCVQDVSTDEAVSVGGEATVRFSVGAADLGSRAYATGVWADELYYAVYNQNGDLLPVSVLPGETPVALQNGAADLEVKLAAGLTYNFIFWAASTEALANGTYTFDWENQKMSLNPEKLVAQDETLDAFYLYVPNVEADGNATPIGVELKRPFAQVNVATSDTEAAAAAGLTVAQTQISIWAHTELNLVSGDVAGFNELTYKYANKAEGELKTGYDWLGMIYVLVDDYATVDVKFGYNTAVGANAVRVLNIPNVPVQRNHRTNIVGEVLTSGKNFDVNIDDEFAGDHEAGIITIGNNSYGTLSAAVAAAADGDQLTLQGDITIGANEPVTTIPADKNLELNLNGKTITATVGNAASLLSRATGNINLFDVRGELTIKGGDIKLKYEAEDMGWSYFSEIFYVGFNGKLTIEDSMLENLGGTAMSYVVDMVNATNTTVIIKNSTLKSTYIPFRVFNNAKNGVNNVTIENSTLEGKYAFWVQYYLGDGRDEATLATNLNFDIFGNGNTYVSTAKPEAPIMYGFDAYYYFDGNGTPVIYDQAVLAYAFGAYTSVKLGADINLDSILKVDNGKTFTLDLNGKTINGTDTTEKNFSVIDNRGELTIQGAGAIKLTATINSGWNRYSAVVANNPGGNLTIKNGVTIEHLGGTDMAYGVDNLTNGKGTSAVTTIENATVKSTYSALRQFLNGVEATNELYVKAGAVIEGANRSIFFHDPSANANTGKLVVEADAQLKGNVRLSVTEGSTEWPVEVSIASAALADGSAVTYNYLPEGYAVVENNGVWTVVENVKSADTQDALNDGVTGDAYIVLGDGNYTLPSPSASGSEVTIAGTKDVVVTIDKPNYSGSDLTLTGITVQGSGYSTGVQHVNTVTYNDVAVLGEFCLYGEKVVFNNCTFELAAGQYIWTYAAKNVEFNNCTFNTVGKAILVYNEGWGASNVAVKGCTFNATGSGKAGAIANQNCAAIEIDNFQTTGVGAAHKVTASNNTHSNNFSGEWRIKNFLAGNAITVNGVEYTQIALDGKLMTKDSSNNVTIVE